MDTTITLHATGDTGRAMYNKIADIVVDELRHVEGDGKTIPLNRAKLWALFEQNWCRAGNGEPEIEHATITRCGTVLTITVGDTSWDGATVFVVAKAQGSAIWAGQHVFFDDKVGEADVPTWVAL